MQLLDVFLHFFVCSSLFYLFLFHTQHSILAGSTSTTSEFKLIPTPTATEFARFSKKRKFVIDKMTVLPTEYVIDKKYRKYSYLLFFSTMLFCYPFLCLKLFDAIEI